MVGFFQKAHLEIQNRDFAGGPWSKLPMQGTQVQFLVGELKSHVQPQKKKEKTEIDSTQPTVYLKISK